MSEILVDNLTGKTSAGDITVTSGSVTMSLQDGVAKVWTNFDGSGTISIRDGNNAASLTDSGTGLYKVNYTNNMLNDDYAANVSNIAQNSQIDGTGNYLTSSVGLRFRNSSFTNTDSALVCVAIQGDLA
jgi:hypothetical protein